MVVGHPEETSLQIRVAAPRLGQARGRSHRLGWSHHLNHKSGGDGQGTPVTSDINVDTVWYLVDSPIRVNPTDSSGYLSVNANLEIEAGEGRPSQSAQPK